MKPIAYAIDFGTSNSLLCAIDGDANIHPPIPLEEHAPVPTLLRSILFFPDQTRCFYGNNAIESYVDHGMTGRLIRSFKKHLPSKSFTRTNIEGRSMRLEDIIGLFLREMKRRADRFFATEVSKVILGRPARFGSNAADDLFAEGRLRKAAEVAGFDEIHFCPEPVAASRDFKEHLTEERIVLVADFGGGTSDFSIIRMSNSGDPNDAANARIDEVLSVGGLSVAGDVLDGCMMRHKIAKHFGAEVTYQVPMSSTLAQTMPKEIMARLCSPAELTLLRRRDIQHFLRNVQNWSLGPDDQQRMDQLFILIDDALGFTVFEEIEKTKVALSQKERATFAFEYPPIEIAEEIAASDFASLITNPTERIFGCLDETIAAAGIKASDIDLVCCTGGTAKVPRIEKEIVDRFGRDKIRQLRSFHSVVHGLAHHGRDLLR